MRVLLITMPFGAIDRPALGLSLLKAGLAKKGISCDVSYLNFRFAEIIGLEAYDWVTNTLPYTAFAGDWCFTAALHGERPAEDRRYIDEVLRGQWQLDDAAIANLQAIKDHAWAFIDFCAGVHEWTSYDVVGFTSTFTQNIASLALAQELKSRFPRLTIVFGGANWEGEMGEELHRRFSFVDYVCQGESDESFPALITQLRSGTPDVRSIPGVVYRDCDDSTATTAPAVPVTAMDLLPIPDYADYFAALRSSGAFADVTPSLLIEMSRGCWWGAKSHCTFCGLNGSGMKYRSKSSARALAELDRLTAQWNISFVSVVDNILDMTYFDNLLPELANRHKKPQLFFEVKANLKRHHIRTLAASGVKSVQPGIESLSDHVLKLMRKGTTGLRNVQMLKWCRELGIKPEWNVLHGFPGETAQDYAAFLGIMESITHLDPPSGCGPVRLDRFSPYFETPGRFGLRNLRPIIPFRTLYPFDAESVKRIAYYFDFDYDPSVDPSGVAAEVVAFAADWARSPYRRTLTATDTGEALLLTDSNGQSPPLRHVLRHYDRAVYLLCDEVQSLDGIADKLHGLYPGQRFDAGGIAAFLQSLIANRLMISDGRHYLSIAIFTVYPEDWRGRLLARRDAAAAFTRRADTLV